MRRNDLLKNTKEELMIREIVSKIESIGTNPLLTKCVIHLDLARNKLADYVDKLHAAISYESYREILTKKADEFEELNGKKASYILLSKDIIDCLYSGVVETEGVERFMFNGYQIIMVSKEDFIGVC